MPIYSLDNAAYTQRVHANGRPPDQQFDPADRLFRRYPKKYLINGMPVPIAMQALQFDQNSGMSVNWSRYSEPQDVLEPDCCEGNHRHDCVVLAFAVSEVPPEVATVDEIDGAFRFLPKHSPRIACHAHSEIWCNRSGDIGQPFERPPKHVRDEFRSRLAVPIQARTPLSFEPVAD